MTAPHIHTETLSYTANGTTLKGHLAYDRNRTGRSPGVLVVHEWWGVNDYIRGRAEQLAALGYTALAIDMYGDGRTADNPDEAGRLMNAVLEDMGTGTARLHAGHAALLAQPRVDGTRTAAIGYCFGGAMALHMARIGMPLKAVASFHGALGSFHKPAPGSVKARVLICHGAADQFISEQEIQACKAELDAAGADYRFVAYQGALHGFTNPGADEKAKKYKLPLAYDGSADKASWAEMRKLFADVL